MFVSDVMSTCVSECTEDARLEEVFELIQQCDHGFVVVVDSLVHRVPIGVVTEHSICEQVIARGRNPKNLVAGSVIDSRVVKLVSTDLVEKLGDANRNDVAAVVVVDASRRVCGVISKEKIRNLSPLAARRAQSSAEGNGISGIPALGWVQ
ncbi:MAG: CBS domain-containing protein [Acidobacteriota bacterium]